MQRTGPWRARRLDQLPGSADGSVDDLERAAHERVDAAEVGIGADGEVGRGRPLVLAADRRTTGDGVGLGAELAGVELLIGIGERVRDAGRLVAGRLAGSDRVPEAFGCSL